jgi:hypothetical protein
MIVAVWLADDARGRADVDVGTDEHSVCAEDRLDELARQPEVDLRIACGSIGLRSRRGK